MRSVPLVDNPHCGRGAHGRPVRIGESRDGAGWGPTPTQPGGCGGPGSEGEPHRPGASPPRRWREKAEYRTTRKRGSGPRQHVGESPTHAGLRRQCRWKPAAADRGPPTSPTPSRALGRTRPARRRRQHPVRLRAKPGEPATAVKARRKLSSVVRAADNVSRPVHSPRSRWDPFIPHSRHSATCLPTNVGSPRASADAGGCTYVNTRIENPGGTGLYPQRNVQEQFPQRFQTPQAISLHGWFRVSHSYRFDTRPPQVAPWRKGK